MYKGFMKTGSKEHIAGCQVALDIQKRFVQDLVDKFLKNKDNSLEDRWEVWTKYSQKNHEDYYHSFPEDKFEGLTDWGCGADGGYPSKYQTVDYCMIANQVNDSDEIKEYLIEQNLGSFTVDW